ncbi:MAG: O-antigen ligase family protein [Bacteroidetes bacterium]|nr:O-antigen ligase family protein [Bacteroidota bacterium]
MKDRIHNRIFWLSSMAISFFLPVFGRILPLIILIMVLNWMINARIGKNISLLFREKKRLQTLSFALIYILYVAGLLYTSNFDYAWFDLEVKFSLLIFPLIFATTPQPLLSPYQYLSVLWAFVAGCIFGAFIILGHAAFNLFSYNYSGSFYYTKLAWYFHTSYLAMYYNFAISFLLLSLLRERRPTLAKILSIGGMVVFFIWMILLLSSKAGLLTLALILIGASFYCWLILGNFRAGTAIIGIGLLVFLSGYLISPVAFSRISAAEHAIANTGNINRINPESNADRMVVWTTAVEIIGNNFLFGVGTGDVKDALLEGYGKRNAIPALQHKYNAHCQYLQTFITLGITGFLLYILLFTLPAIFALKTKHYLYLAFLLIFAVNTLTESMLEIQAGVIFYAFFNIILFTRTGAFSGEARINAKTGTRFPESPPESK